MTIKSQQIEFDVFPKEQKNEYAYLGNIKNDITTESSSINVVFSHQSVIIICICAVMLLVASFSLGVEKGKLLAKNNTPTAEKTNIAVANNAITPTTAIAQQAETIQNNLPVTNQKNITLLAQTKTTEAKNETLLAEEKSSSEPKEEIQTKTSAYTIQIASLKNESAAKGMIDFLAKRGFNPSMKSSGKYIIVLAGNFAKKEEAQVKLKELKKTYTDCYIRRI